MKIRIDKALSEMGIGTRTEVKKACKAKRIKVNGELCKDSSVKIDPELDTITLDDEVIEYEQFSYFMLNKPQGYISASTGDGTVMELIDEGVRDLFPCGRLDKDTEGLLLITNDGQLAHQLLSPNHHVDKEYYVELRDSWNDTYIDQLKSGMTIDGGEVCLPAEAKRISDHSCTIILHEGKYHEVKRLFLALGNEVVYLKRLRMKNLILDESLKPGAYRKLTIEELEDLKG